LDLFRESKKEYKESRYKEKGLNQLVQRRAVQIEQSFFVVFGG